jgi:hypothetical protein
LVAFPSRLMEDGVRLYQAQQRIEIAPKSHSSGLAFRRRTSRSSSWRR